MNIKILDSWLRDYLATSASPKKLAEVLTLTSVSVEKIIPSGNDFIYEIEVTTNRPDLTSIVGLAREAAAALHQFDIKAEFTEPKFSIPKNTDYLPIEIVNNPKLVNRICAVALDVKLFSSPEKIQARLLASGINPHNNVIDVTNYVMREIGHPMHAFDYSKLMVNKKMDIRESKKGEKIVDLHGVTHQLAGGDIIADDGNGEIIDLLGVIGTENSSINNNTNRVLLFVDNNDPVRIRKTSMGLAIRTEAATLNEKGVDPEASMHALLRGIDLLAEIADATVVSEIVDIYPGKTPPTTVSVASSKINSLIGIDIPQKTAVKILKDLGFDTKILGNQIEALVPSWRTNDVGIAEDIIEEVARVYGYQRLPTVLPSGASTQPTRIASNPFHWESRVRTALKYWGFTEIYSSPLVSENMLEEAPEEAVTIKNPLTEDHVFMRRTLVPSLLAAVRENKNREELKLFEISNVYLKRRGELPQELLRLAGVIKHPRGSFYEAKGVILALLEDVGIYDVSFKESKSGAVGSDLYIGKEHLGEIEVLEPGLIDFELEFETILKHASLRKIYKPTSKFPEAVEDMRFEIDEKTPYGKIVGAIRGTSELIKEVRLLDVYKDKKTFRIIYQSQERNLTAEDLSTAREKIIAALKKSFKAQPA